MQEKEIIELAKAGNPEAWEKLISTWHPKIYYFVLKYLGNEEDAKDVTQEVFFSVSRNLSSLRSTEAFSTWIYKIALNCVRQYVKKAARSRQLLSEPSHFSPKREEGLIEKALNYIPSQQKEVILLKEIEGFSIKEIAEMLSIPEGTVKSRLFYGLKTLREVYLKLKEERYEELQ